MKYSYKKIKFIKNRDDEIIKRCRGKRVLHIGATDSPYTKDKFLEGMLLHTRIMSVAEDVQGWDIDQESIDYLASKNINNIECSDMNDAKASNYKPNLIVFGEIIEHVQNLKIALKSLENSMDDSTELIITTPNLFSLSGFLQVIRKNQELIHPDHKVGFTYALLRQLLEDNNFKLEDFGFTFLHRKKLKWTKKITKLFCRLRPGLSETLFAVIKLK